MFLIKSKNNFFYLLILLFVLAEFIVDPTGNYCLNDDWTYAKSVLSLYLNKGYNIGSSSASIWSHLMWGLIFVKTFGFSLLILRVSTLISALIAIVVLFKLVSTISNSRTWVPFTACAVMLFNPIFFNLMNSYMSDVNFNTLLIISIYFSYHFFTTQHTGSFIMIFVTALLLVLLRQFGIILPICMTFASLFISKRRWFYTSWSALFTLFILIIFKYYEHYVEINHCAEGYQSSSKVALFDPVFHEKINMAIKMRFFPLLVNCMVFTLPFLLLFLPALIKRSSLVTILFLTFLSFGIGFYLCFDKNYLIGNVFENMNVGAETFFQTLNEERRSPHPHTYSPEFEKVWIWITSVCISIFLFIILLLLSEIWKTEHIKRKISPITIYFLSLLLMYMAVLMIFDSYIDRYNIPLFTMLIIVFSFLSRKYTVTFTFSALLLVGSFYIAVFGTKDYLSMNFKKAEAYNHLRVEKKVPMEKINAGYEMNLWHEGKYVVSYEPVFLEGHQYLIQYRKEPEFEIYKEYEFQRYFPYKKDKIYIFVRRDKN